MAKEKERQTVRILCDVEGYEECWAEIDVTTWGYAEYLDIWTSAFPLVAIKYFEPYCFAWHVVNDEGTVIAHPGPNADRERWTRVYQQLGVEASRALGDWFPKVCVLAAAEAQQLTPKRISNDSSGSGGEEGTSDGGEG